MAYSTERNEAKRLYVEEGKSIKDISTTLNVPEKTLYRWSTDDAWEKDKDTLALTGISTIKNSMMLAVRALETMVQTGTIDARNVDAIMKLIKGAKSLSKDLDKRGNIMLGLSEYVEFLRDGHAEELQRIQPFLAEFGNWVKRKYP